MEELKKAIENAKNNGFSLNDVTMLAFMVYDQKPTIAPTYIGGGVTPPAEENN